MEQEGFLHRRRRRRAAGRDLRNAAARHPPRLARLVAYLLRRLRGEGAQQQGLAGQRLVLPVDEIDRKPQPHQRLRRVPSATQREQLSVGLRLPSVRRFRQRWRNGLSASRPDQGQRHRTLALGVGSAAGALSDIRLRHEVGLRQRQVGLQPALQLQSRRAL